MRKKKRSIITGLIVGGAVASVVGMFFSKKRNRDKMKDIGGKLVDTIKSHLGKK